MAEWSHNSDRLVAYCLWYILIEEWREEFQYLVVKHSLEPKEVWNTKLVIFF